MPARFGNLFRKKGQLYEQNPRYWLRSFKSLKESVTLFHLLYNSYGAGYSSGYSSSGSFGAHAARKYSSWRWKRKQRNKKLLTFSLSDPPEKHAIDCFIYIIFRSRYINSSGSSSSTFFSASGKGNNIFNVKNNNACLEFFYVKTHTS